MKIISEQKLADLLRKAFDLGRSHGMSANKRYMTGEAVKTERERFIEEALIEASNWNEMY